MKKYILLIIVSICTLWGSAQTRGFVDGETIEFFPVSSVFNKEFKYNIKLLGTGALLPEA